jgi:hypothetical protein
MTSSLVETLAVYDAENAASVAAVDAAFTQFAGGSLYKQDDRARFWERARNADAGAIIRLLVRAYVAHRRQYLRNMEHMWRIDEATRLLTMTVNVHMMLVLEDAGDCTAYCLDEVAAMLLDDDSEIYFVACKMLAGSPCPRRPKVLQPTSRGRESKD